MCHRFVLRPYTFGKLLWPKLHIWNRDVDGFSNQEVLSRLSFLNGVPPERASKTTVASLEGRLFHQHQPHGKTKWLLRLGIFHRSRRLFGQQFCPLCLRSDDDPYFRLNWRLSFSTVCLKHQTALLDRCADCGAPVEFHRIDPLKACMVTCYQCGKRLTKQRTPRCSAIDLEFARKFEIAMSRSTVDIGSLRQYPAVDFTALAGQICRVVMTGARSQALRDVLHDHYGFDPAPYDFRSQAFEFEVLDVNQRRRLLRMCAPLILDWPRGFIRACQEAGVWSTWANKDTKQLPAAYLEVVRTHLQGLNLRSLRIVSRVAAKKLLKRSGTCLANRSKRSGIHTSSGTPVIQNMKIDGLQRSVHASLRSSLKNPRITH